MNLPKFQFGYENKELLIESKIKSNINQYEFNGGVAQLVRARDS